MLETVVLCMFTKVAIVAPSELPCADATAAILVGRLERTRGGSTTTPAVPNNKADPSVGSCSITKTGYRSQAFYDGSSDPIPVSR